MAIETMSVTFRQVAETKDERQRDPADDVVSVFDHVAQEQPNETAVMSIHQKDHLGMGTLRWTYSDLRDGSIRLAHRLKASELKPGSRIAAFLYNEMEWAVLFLASARAGCHFVPMDPRTLSQPAEAVYLLKKISVEAVFVSNTSLACLTDTILQEESMPQVQLKSVIIADVEGPACHGLPRGWTSLADLMAALPPTASGIASLKRDDTILLMCTSGTTSRPKVCPHTSVSIVTPAMGLADDWSLTREDQLCQHLPPFHIFNIALTLAFWISGGTVVIPSAEFNPAASFEAISIGTKVLIPCVPTMVHAMHNYSMATETKLPSPFAICLGGAPITPDVLHTCRALGAKRIIAGYGTTEGVATLLNTMDADDRRITKAKSGDDVCLGTAKAGTYLRICAPGSRTPLRRGDIGELHQGGYPVFDKYLNGSAKDDSACYREKGVPWFATGDRGYMDENGCIYLLGRYKDLIIRGGENISPLKIEQYLCSQPGVVTAVVLGAPDDIVGEVPVAVIETRNGSSRKFFTQLQYNLVKALGPSFAPKLILHLQNDLCRERYPSTASGKVQKSLLRKLVVAYLQTCNTPIARRTRTNISTASTHPPGGNPQRAANTVGLRITEELTAGWSAVSGMDHNQIKPDMPIRTFTDSVMLIQFLDLARKKGWILTLKDLLSANTIEKQALLLRLKENVAQPSLSAVSQSTVVATFLETNLQKVASHLGYAAFEIEGLLPMTDIFRVMAMDRPYPGAWDFRVPFLVRRALNVDQIMVVVKTWLQRHELLRSTIAASDSGEPIYVVMYPYEHWLKRQIIHGAEVDDINAVGSYRVTDHLDSGYGPLCKVTVLPVRNTSHCGLVLQIHHVIFDGLVLERWLQDLNHLLDGRPRLTWQPYCHFAAAYDEYRSTPEADQSVKFFVCKLGGISKAKDAIFRIDHCSETDNKVHFDRLKANGIIGPGHAGYTRTHLNSEIRLPYLSLMRSSFGISAPIIALAACSLINVRHTGAWEAIFLNLQSGRSWPLAANTGTAPSHLIEIDGPTITYPVARIPIASEETALDLLCRLRADQDEMMVHAHAPMNRIFEELEREEYGAADVNMIKDLFHGQLFDWLLEPFTVKPEDALELIGTTQLSPTSWLWMPSLRGGDILHVDFFHQYPDLPEEKAKCVLQEFLCTASWLADPDNAQKPVSECLNF